MAYNLCGQKFNRLTVIRKHGHMGKKVTWECLCECGNITHVGTNDLTSGNTKSCGCLNNEKVRNINLSHGMTGTKIYDVWCGIKQRCYYKKHTHYKHYGGRGIKMCKRWLDFKNFFNDMAEGYKEGLTIERIDNNGDYCPENCKWADAYWQSNNRRYNRVETVQGITDTIANLCRRFNIKSSTVYQRLHNGWPVEEALTKPLQKNQYKAKDA